MQRLFAIIAGVAAILFGVYTVFAGASYRGASYEGLTPQACMYGCMLAFFGVATIWLSEHVCD